MKWKASIILFVLIILSCSSIVYAENDVHFNFGLVPGGFIVAPDADGFEARRSGTYTRTTETVKGSVGYAPGGFIGLDIDPPESGVGFDVFGNWLWSDVVNGSMYGANIAYIFPHDEDGIIRLKAKGGFVIGSLNWDSDNTDVEFDNSTGWQGGLGFEVGRTVRFYSEVLYRSLKFDVDKKKSDPVNQDEFDLSGAVINLGVKFSF